MDEGRLGKGPSGPRSSRHGDWRRAAPFRIVTIHPHTAPKKATTKKDEMEKAERGGPVQRGHVNAQSEKGGGDELKRNGDRRRFASCLG